MATYKVIQDIEAEDHILGPLTLRQFIYGLVAALFLYLSFISIAKHAGFLLAIFLPPALFTGFFAFPFGKDQPTEIWALAKIRFLFKPRRRIWDQSGVKELVTITVPKKIERTYTDGLSQTEVKSRLHALADTIDSRGWAIKNVNVNLYSQPSLIASESSDRLIDIGSIPQAVLDYDISASDDILDEQSNPVAQQFTQMINASTQTHRQQLIDELNTVRSVESQKQTANAGKPADYWFLNQPVEPPKVPNNNAIFQAQVVTPAATADTAVPGPSANADVTPDEAALIEHAKQQNNAQQVSYSHLRTIQPLGATPPAQPSDSAAQSTSGNTPDPAILELANNNDLNVATLARQAKRAKGSDEEGEVVISLH